MSYIISVGDPSVARDFHLRGFLPRFSLPRWECRRAMQIPSRNKIALSRPFLLFSALRGERALVLPFIPVVRYSRPINSLVDSSRIRGKVVSMMGCLARDNNDNNDAQRAATLFSTPLPITKATRQATREDRSHEACLKEDRE